MKQAAFFVLAILVIIAGLTACNAQEEDMQAYHAIISDAVTSANDSLPLNAPLLSNEHTGQEPRSPVTVTPNEPTPVGNQQVQTQTAEPLCPYTSFRYGMRIIEDSMFTEEVWNAVRFDDWMEIDERKQTWESSTTLSFYSAGENFNIRIVPTDEAWVLKPVLDGINEFVAYYIAPDGTYDALTTMLADYIEKNFKYDLTPQILRDLIYSSQDLEFILFGEADYYVKASSVGRFMDEWDMENWEEFQMPDGERTMEDVIRIHRRNFGAHTEIDIYLGYLDVSVYSEWEQRFYKISQDTADMIYRQFKEFQELAYSTVDWDWDEIRARW